MNNKIRQNIYNEALKRKPIFLMLLLNLREENSKFMIILILLKTRQLL